MVYIASKQTAIMAYRGNIHYLVHDTDPPTHCTSKAMLWRKLKTIGHRVFLGNPDKQHPSTLMEIRSQSHFEKKLWNKTEHIPSLRTNFCYFATPEDEQLVNYTTFEVYQFKSR